MHNSVQEFLALKAAVMYLELGENLLHFHVHGKHFVN